MLQGNSYYIVQKQSNNTDDESWETIAELVYLDSATTVKDKLSSADLNSNFRIQLKITLFITVVS